MKWRRLTGAWLGGAWGWGGKRGKGQRVWDAEKPGDRPGQDGVASQKGIHSEMGKLLAFPGPRLAEIMHGCMHSVST